MRIFSAKKSDNGGRWKLLYLSAVAIAVLAGAIYLRQVLTPVIIALVIAYILDPPLSWLERHRVRRWLATGILYILILALLATGGVTLGPRIWEQAQRMYHNVSGLAQNYGSTILEPEGQPGLMEQGTSVDSNDRSHQAEAGGGEVTAGPVNDDEGARADPSDGGAEHEINEKLDEWKGRAQDYLQSHADEIASRVASLVITVSQNALRGLSNAANFVFGLVLVLVFTFFFMLHFREMTETVKRYIPAAHRERALDIIGRIDGTMANFFRGRLMVCVIAGIVYVVGLRLSGIDFWLLIGLVGGVMSFIPILGVILPMIPACAFALLTGNPWASLLGVLLTFSVVQWVVEPVANTLILSRQVKMHPVTIMLALLIGGTLFGVFGLLLSVPLTAIIRILGEEFVLPPLREMAGESERPK